MTDPSVEGAAGNSEASTTMVVLSHNRSAFLRRLCDYLRGNLPTHVAQVAFHVSGTEDQLADTKELIRDLDDSRRMRFHLYPDGVTFQGKISQALAAVGTRYVLMAADDDFYFFPWLDKAIPLMDAEPQLGAVYGNFMEFKLERFKPYGEAVDFVSIGKSNMFLPFLEERSMDARLASIGAAPELLNATWYSLQRTDNLQRIVSVCDRIALDDERAFERYYIFGQAALGASVMLKDIFLARQFNNEFKRPQFSRNTDQEAIEQAMVASRYLLTQDLQLSEADAAALVRDTFRNTLDVMKRADRKAVLRLVAERLPLVRKLWSLIRGPMPLQVANERLPASPTFEECLPYIQLVERSVKAPAVA